MKYKTFARLRNTGCFGVIASIVGLVYVNSGGKDIEEIPAEKQGTYGSYKGTESNEENSTYSVIKDSRALLPFEHKQIISFQEKSTLADGKHDPNNNGVKLYKKFADYYLDLRCDKEKGFDYFNRVKVDLDKDKNWDEKWTFSQDGTIKRECSSKDDNNYDLVYELVDGYWKKPDSDENTTNKDFATNSLSPLHQDILNFQKKSELIDGKHDPNNNGVKFYRKFADYYLDLRCDKEKGFDYFNRVKVDLDKDKNWDEKWTFSQDGTIKRECSSKDNNNYDLVYELIDGDWKAPSSKSNASTENTISNTSIATSSLPQIHQDILNFHKKSSLGDGKHDPNNNGVKLYKKFADYYLDLRCDKEKGFNYFNRIKIDWDKDKNWDEKWFLRQDGTIKRECSSKDDKKYDLVYELIDGNWKKK